jgi:hypothetical protein
MIVLSLEIFTLKIMINNKCMNNQVSDFGSSEALVLETSLRICTNSLWVGMEAVIKLWSRWQNIFNTLAAT